MNLLQQFARALVNAMRPDIERAVDEALAPCWHCDAAAAELLPYGQVWLCRPCWIASDERDELEELLFAEREDDIAAAEFEARLEVDPPVRRRVRRAA